MDAAGMDQQQNPDPTGMDQQQNPDRALLFLAEELEPLEWMQEGLALSLDDQFPEIAMGGSGEDEGEMCAQMEQAGDDKRKDSIGVSKHKNSKRWEAHIWMRDVRLRGRKRKGMQLFLGNFEQKEHARVAHDRAAIKLGIYDPAFEEKKKKQYALNFDAACQATFMAENESWTIRDFVWKIRRFSSDFSCGQSSMKGVSVRTRSGKRKRSKGGSVWYESKISSTGFQDDPSKNSFLLGTFATEEEAGQAYDRALLYLHQDCSEEEQLNCVTNFRPSNYAQADIESMGRFLVEKHRIKMAGALQGSTDSASASEECTRSAGASQKSLDGASASEESLDSAGGSEESMNNSVTLDESLEKHGFASEEWEDSLCNLDD